MVACSNSCRQGSSVQSYNALNKWNPTRFLIWDKTLLNLFWFFSSRTHVTWTSRNIYIVAVIILLLLIVLIFTTYYIPTTMCSCQHSSCEHKLLIADLIPVNSAPLALYWQTQSMRYFYSPEAHKTLQNGELSQGERSASCAADMDGLLKRISSMPTRDLVFVYVDSGYAAMAINLYITCIKPSQTDNYIYVYTDNPGCEQMKAAGLIHYPMCIGSLEAGLSIYGTVSWPFNPQSAEYIFMEPNCFFSVWNHHKWLS